MSLFTSDIVPVLDITYQTHIYEDCSDADWDEVTISVIYLK